MEGPPIPITTNMIKKVISQMKVGKAPGPSGIVLEIIRAVGDTGASMIRDLQLQSSVMARYPPIGSRVSLSVSTRVRGYIGREQLPWSQVDRAGHKSPGEDCGRPYQTGGVNRRFPVLASSQVEAQQMQSLSSGTCKKSI